MEGMALMGTHIAAAANVFALVAAVLLLVWTIHFGGGISLHSSNKTRLLNAHTVVMFMGFIFLAGQAIMAFKIIPAPKKLRKAAHMTLQLASLAMGIFGVYAAFKYHRELNIPDMSSLHSWLGMITISLFALQWLVGFFIFWFPGLRRPARAVAAPPHVAAGLGLFLLAVAAAETGLVQGAAGPGSESLVINFSGLFILLYALLVSIFILLPRLSIPK